MHNSTNITNSTAAPLKPFEIMSVVPSIVLAVIIVACAAVYELIAKKLVDLENHRDQQSYE